MMPRRLRPTLRGPTLFALALCALALWPTLAAIAAGPPLPGGRGPAQAQAQSEPGEDLAALEGRRAAQRQPLLLERALAGLQGSARGQAPQIYFVAFAGYGSQAVFKREALAVQALFDARFGTRGRSLVLINHASTVDDVALATQTNLDKALLHIGGLMNKDDDILFLFLTSHGQKDLFAVEMPGVQLDPLTPTDLKAILDRSGIRNRVIVVSACHSGSFIPALAGPSTLVIAAAHAERTSFGCEDRREWTYFGDAYFNRSLRRERSFERAFERARRLIGRWEAAEGLQRSLPQIAGGEALRPRLDRIARRKATSE